MLSFDIDVHRIFDRYNTVGTLRLVECQKTAFGPQNVRLLDLESETSLEEALLSRLY